MRGVLGGWLLALVFAGGALADLPPGAAPFPPELEARLAKALETSPSRTQPRTRHRMPDGSPRYTNRLILEQSPYLLQHAHNPVNWFPWGDEAFAQAKQLNRPVLLSVGYSTCHWCHVMEEESFEDPEIAEYMNANYIAIKVDREERPDVDDVYMAAIHAMSGRGGWPMTVWLTPAREPFYGGTYFPPRDSPNGKRRGFLTVLRQLSGFYAQDRLKAGLRASAIAETIREALAPPPSVGVPGSDDIKRALAHYKRRFDAKNGGLSRSRKFPSSLPIVLLLRSYRRTGDAELLQMARKTLDAMRRGGIYDHLGGGFHRYTTESTWTVPHFEKMLYDNALLVVAYLEAFQVTGEEAYAAVARDVLDYVAREMTSPHGAFYSATDADSEGEEGVFFVWTPKQIQEAVGPEHAKLALSAYGLAGKRPNFERTHYVLRRDLSVEELAAAHGMTPSVTASALKEIRAKLYQERAKREPPLLDDKQLVAWNGLMISAFARAGLVLREPRYVEQAARAAAYLLEHARPHGQLARYVRNQKPHGTGLLDDYAFLEAGLLDLFEATGDARWLADTRALQRDLDARFFDDEAGGYWISPDDGERLLVRAKPASDGALPSGNSIAVMNLLRLYTLTTDADYQMRAEMCVRVFSDSLHAAPTGHARMLEAVDFMLDRPKEILIVTPEGRDGAEPFLRELAGVYLPNRVLVTVSESEAKALVPEVPWLERKRALRDAPTAYVCEDRVCDLPARSSKVFGEQLRKKPYPYPEG
ncbi:MAG: thioredoxin domain-containing protein [Deltaproteobacteria bacterium]|nr:thioredoxin domain-containing protein [Deltaproteobacteria bacterium]